MIQEDIIIHEVQSSAEKKYQHYIFPIITRQCMTLWEKRKKLRWIFPNGSFNV